ncbi:hypothetical protein [Denitratisoma sp. agr-D3]
MLLDDLGLRAYRKHGRALSLEETFGADAPGREAFATYLRRHEDSRFTVVADLVDEEFREERIPPVHGRDRRALLARRLEQCFHGLPHLATLSLGRSRQGRRDESVLLAALPRTALISPWLEILKTTGSRCSGLYSMPFLVAAWHRRRQTAGVGQLVLTMSRGGLRQTYCAQGQVRFSRLTPMATLAAEDIARHCMAEAMKISHYLAGQSPTGDQAPLPVLLLAHRDDHPLLRQHCHDTDHLSFIFLDLAQEYRRLHPASTADHSLCEEVLLSEQQHWQRLPQFASADLLRPHRLWWLRRGLDLVALAGLTVCLLLAVGVLLHAHTQAQRNQDMAVAAQQDRERYEAMLATLPTVPIGFDALRDRMASFFSLEKHSPSLDSVLTPLSRALDDFPGIELEHIHWRLSDTPNEDIGLSQTVRPPANNRQDTAGRQFSILELDAKLMPVTINRDQRDDIESLAQALTQTPRTHVAIRRHAQTDASAGVLRDRAATIDERPAQAFSLRFIRRLD